ncbi:hypothetical protein T1J70_09965 [Lactiplantibacillus plantarum]|nr:hypothetical protein [Lactiplantibacillus plantarum]WEZ94082.1 hypothetical protein P3T69_13110 [Lactiplantibacillus plantarum]WQG54217.1 hypothetical protein T1J70_09965 [Lactiplantibacillus plantarum]
METIKAIHTRHSVRAFKDDPIEPQLLTMIVTDAQQTPRGAIHNHGKSILQRGTH